MMDIMRAHLLHIFHQHWLIVGLRQSGAQAPQSAAARRAVNTSLCCVWACDFVKYKYKLKYKYKDKHTYKDKVEILAAAVKLPKPPYGVCSFDFVKYKH